jgi:hypothetical protein
MEVFTAPKLAAEINFGTKVFSMTAWVRTVPQFLEGYILRKRPTAGSSLSCVGWHLHALTGPGLHYGAHVCAYVIRSAHVNLVILSFQYPHDFIDIHVHAA